MDAKPIILVFLIFFVVGLAVHEGLLYFNKEYFAKQVEFRTKEISPNKCTIDLLAINSEKKGIVIPLTVEIKPGTGKILVNIDNPSFIVDTQDAMRIAVKQASRIINNGLREKDIIFSFSTNVSTIEGPSAGAAMAICIIATYYNKSLNKDYLITGGISQDGLITPVGGILEKAKAAKEAGAKAILVPPGQSFEYVEKTNCNKTVSEGRIEERCIGYVEKVNVADSVGIQVIEVRTLTDAMKYLLGE
ncbi:MAG: S16 family serine protease [archaeon]